jgi:phenylalanyl-tRNA synthetase beta chain
MKISLKWLNDFVPVDDFYGRADELSRILTAAGLEVESVENPSESLKNVVVGQILKLDRHPNADRLTLCQLDVGDGRPRQIVCGAKNHKQGDKVAVALPGAVLPGNFVIKLSKIRDVESEGMLASESELGFKKEAEGILILPADAPVGEPFAKYFGKEDILLEINVSPNRADCLSHRGLAREIAALLDRPLKERILELNLDPSLSTKKSITLEVKDHALCPRYSGRVLTNIQVGPAPEFIRQRLEAVGMHSINNVVDITNYVMMELGQPMHAFDLDHLKGGRIAIARSTVGETFVSLDGTECKMGGDELTIRDSERPVCLAGVVGGKNSGVSDSTTRVFLESAHFAMDSVRKTSRRLGLQTDSAYRFSRGTDPAQVVDALNLASSLLQRYAGAKVASDFYDVYPKPASKQPIAITLQQVTERLGFTAESSAFSGWMKRLGCEVVSKEAGHFLITPPLFRSDLEVKEDLIEEFGRLEGYDKIPEILPIYGDAPLKHAEEYTFEMHLGRVLEEEGLAQAINYGFIGSKYQNQFVGPVDRWAATGLQVPAEPIRVRNPLNEDLDAMRFSLAPWLYRNFIYNYRHGINEGRLFETGFTFQTAAEGYAQTPRLAIVGWGSATGLWQKTPNLVYFDLKTAIENALQRLRVGGPKGSLKTITFQSLEFRQTEKLPHFLHPAQSAVIFCEGKSIGYIGSLHPKFLNDEKITCDAAIVELDLTPLRRGQPRPIKFQPISKLPSSERDFAFVVPKSVLSSAISAEIKKAAGGSLQSLEIFDVFEDGNLPEGFRSVAYRLILQDPANTLTDIQLQALQSSIFTNLEKKLGIRVR